MKPAFPIDVEVKRLKSITGDWLLNKDTKIANEDWLRLVKDFEEGISPRMRIFLILRREKRDSAGRNGWTSSIQLKYAERAAKAMGTTPEEEWIDNRHTFKDWWNELLLQATIIAASRGLFK